MLNTLRAGVRSIRTSISA